MIFGEFVYSESIEKLEAFDAQGLWRALEILESKKHQGYWVGYIRYEAGEVLLGEEMRALQGMAECMQGVACGGQSDGVESSRMGAQSNGGQNPIVRKNGGENQGESGRDGKMGREVRGKAWSEMGGKMESEGLIGELKHEAGENLPRAPLLYFECFLKKEPFSRSYASASVATSGRALNLPALTSPASSTHISCASSASPNPTSKESFRFCPQVVSAQGFEDYERAIEQIKEAIKRGDSYQLNYTYPIELATHCEIERVFLEVLENQDTAYKAFITNEYESIASFSPELFFQKRGACITTRPMKGTIARGEDSLKDAENRAFLKNDEKNRSENVMIVDLLRNDLSKITHEVEVSKLFEVLSYPTLHQMISEIRGILKEGVSFRDILLALFPCGSITGAPKLKTMEIIRQLEGYARGVYCGMIGVIEGEDMCFSVPIRTIVQNHAQNRGQNLGLNPSENLPQDAHAPTTPPNRMRLCVGSGVVWDSDAHKEFLESVLKSRFIYPKLEFSIIETMLVRAQGGGEARIENLDLHQRRMRDSARYFGFGEPDFGEVGRGLREYLARRDGGNSGDNGKADLGANDASSDGASAGGASEWVLRILLDKNGALKQEYRLLDAPKSLEVRLAPAPIVVKNDFMSHKLDYAPWYEEARAQIARGEVFDWIFYDEEGWLTEGARSNIVLLLDGGYYTPKLRGGMLNGVMRQKLLLEGRILERKLRVEDLSRAQKVFCINALRGMLEVEYVEVKRG